MLRLPRVLGVAASRISQNFLISGKREGLPIKMQDLKISNVKVVPCKDSRFIKTSRVKFTQNNLERTWDYVNIHDSVAVLMFNTSRMAFILVRQFRPALYMYINNEINGKERTQITEDNCEISITAPPQVGVSYELCAGIVDKKMSLEEIAKCEVMEETGYDISSVQLELIMKSRSVGTAGNSQTIYFAEVTDDMNTGQGGGNPDENEQIELEYIPLSEAKHFVFDGSKSKPSSLVAAFMWYFWKNKIP